MQLPTLYKITSTGAQQEWTIFVDGPSFYTVSGQTEGKKVTSSPTVCKAKNVGRSNETTPEEQAEQEAKARWQKKRDEGYIEDVDALDGAGAGRYNPMLAKNYDDYKDELVFPVYSQPKLDGLRMIVTRHGAYSRLWKPFSSVMSHIQAALQPLFEKYPEIKAFDGEIYNHSLKDNFEKIVSLAKKTKPTQEDIEEAEDLLEFHIYDYIPDKNTVLFDTRQFHLRHLFSGFRHNAINRVRTILCSAVDLNAEYDLCLEAGYEGQMIRNPNAPYQHKRTKDLLKRKEFTDGEFKIVGYSEGEGNRAGCIILRLATNEGKEFDSVPKGSIEYQQKLWQNRDRLLGCMATVKYQNLSQEGIPRFNNTIKIRTKDLEEIAI